MQLGISIIIQSQNGGASSTKTNHYKFNEHTLLEELYKSGVI